MTLRELGNFVATFAFNAVGYAVQRAVVWVLRNYLHPNIRTNNSATGRNGSTGDANNCRDNSNGRGTHTDTHDKAGRRSRLARKLQPSQWRERPHPDRREKALRTIPTPANCTRREASSTTDWDSVSAKRN